MIQFIAGSRRVHAVVKAFYEDGVGRIDAQDVSELKPGDAVASKMGWVIKDADNAIEIGEVTMALVPADGTLRAVWYDGTDMAAFLQRRIIRPEYVDLHFVDGKFVGYDPVTG